MVILKVLARLSIIIVLLTGAAFILLIGIDQFYRHRSTLPPLASDLPPTLEAARHAFDRRLSKEFPLGTNEAILVARLSQEGWGRISQNGAEKSVTVRRQHSLIIEQRVSIVWQVDAQGRLVAIHGLYGLTGP